MQIDLLGCLDIHAINKDGLQVSSTASKEFQKRNLWDWSLYRVGQARRVVDMYYEQVERGLGCRSTARPSIHVPFYRPKPIKLFSST